MAEVDENTDGSYMAYNPQQHGHLLNLPPALRGRNVANGEMGNQF
jgi:hypothetical protein